MRKKILVTGGLGYIGSHTVVELIAQNYDVLIIDNLSNSLIEILNRIQKITNIKPDFKKIDVCDKTQFFDAIEKQENIEGIIHFAAHKAVGESVINPIKYYRNNLTGMLNVLEAMKTFDIKNLVFSSSCTVYGQPDNLPVTEDSPIKPAESPYGNTKRINEEMISDYLHNQKDHNTIILRYFNPIGAHPSGLIGELPLGVPDNLLPYITQTVIGKRDILRVFGNDYNTPDGTPIRDYIDVTDLAKAHIAALKRIENKKNKRNKEIYNVGVGKGLSVLEIIHLFKKSNKEHVNYMIAPRREGDIEQVWADTTKSNKELNWKAERNIEDTLRSAWNWEKNYNKLNK